MTPNISKIEPKIEEIYKIIESINIKLDPVLNYVEETEDISTLKNESINSSLSASLNNIKNKLNTILNRIDL